VSGSFAHHDILSLEEAQGLSRQLREVIDQIQQRMR
jgi:hypothetical protein